MNRLRRYRRRASILMAAVFVSSLFSGCTGDPGTGDLTALSRTSGSAAASLPTVPPSESPPPTEAGPLTLTRANLTALSDSRNIIVFLIDRFDENYAEKAYRETPGVYDELTGFTWFQDNISLFGHTYPAIPWMLTNKPYSCAQDRRDYLSSAFDGDTPLKRLNDAGYTVNIYTESVYSYAELSELPDYFANVRPCPDPDADAYQTDTKWVYESICETDFTLNKGKTFSFIHVAGCHDVSYDENFETPGEEDAWNYAVSVRASFRLVDRYIREMKRLGIYDDATIVITGDHPAAINDSREVLETRVTALFVKPSGSADAALKQSSAQVSQEDLWATIFKSEGLDFAADYGISVFDVPENADRLRIHRWQTYVYGSLDEYVYEITGPGADLDNWNLVSLDHYDKFLMD